MKDRLIGAGWMLAFITLICTIYWAGYHNGATEVRMQAYKYGYGQYGVVGDPWSEFHWFQK